MLSKNNATVHRLLLTSGIVGPLCAHAGDDHRGRHPPSYTAWTMAGSSLSLSSYGWTQMANVMISGLLILCFAAAAYASLPTGMGRFWGPVLIAAVGVGLVLAGIFVTDPALGYPPGTPPGPVLHTTVHGALHWALGGLVVFGGLPAACFVFARRWSSYTRSKGWSLYSLSSGIAILTFFVGFTIASAHRGPAGLLERISLLLGMLWRDRSGSAPDSRVYPGLHWQHSRRRRHAEEERQARTSVGADG